MNYILINWSKKYLLDVILYVFIYLFKFLDVIGYLLKWIDYKKILFLGLNMLSKN